MSNDHAPREERRLRLVQLPEATYRVLLARLIHDYDTMPGEAECAAAGVASWGECWTEFLKQCSPDQERRAEEVLRLHVKNQADPLTHTPPTVDPAEHGL